MRFRSTAKVLAECKLKYYRSSECEAVQALPMVLDIMALLPICVQECFKACEARHAWPVLPWHVTQAMWYLSHLRVRILPSSVLVLARSMHLVWGSQVA